MSKPDAGLNFGTMVEEALKRELRDEVKRRIVADLVADFEGRANELVEEYTKNITLEGVERWRDYMALRDEINIYINTKK